ncbi:DUF6265 family protein [Sphingomonas sp. ST-64]|uniref:DUF6265 family protein n=2 Tax=Sphingomonas plantiphila TaxID=3163295 RepID=A0ABW8YPX0_9SPHN
MTLALIVAGETPNLAWLEGEWCTEPVDGRQTCELWGPARGGTMLGTSQTVRDGKTRAYEYMRIELEDEIAIFHGSPQGAPRFRFARADARRAGLPSPIPVTIIRSAFDTGGAAKSWSPKSRWPTGRSRCAGCSNACVDRS